MHEIAATHRGFRRDDFHPPVLCFDRWRCVAVIGGGDNIILVVEYRVRHKVDNLLSAAWPTPEVGCCVDATLSDRDRRRRR